MPNKVDPRDFLYRKVNPKQWTNLEAKVEAFQDKHPNLSLNLASIASPMSILDFFATLPAVKQKYGNDVTGERLYQEGYRIAVMPASVITANNYAFKPESDGSEYRSNGHVNVRDGQNGAPIWKKECRILNEEEMKQGILSLPSTSSPSEPPTSDDSLPSPL